MQARAARSVVDRKLRSIDAAVVAGGIIGKGTGSRRDRGKRAGRELLGRQIGEQRRHLGAKLLQRRCTQRLGAGQLNGLGVFVHTVDEILVM